MRVFCGYSMQAIMSSQKNRIPRVAEPALFAGHSCFKHLRQYLIVSTARAFQMLGRPNMLASLARIVPMVYWNDQTDQSIQSNLWITEIRMLQNHQVVAS